MTEITELNAARYIVDPVAFFAALVGGPILFTAATFWIMFIPVVALALGSLPYLVVGAPILLVHLRRNPPDIINIAWTALMAFIALWVVCMLGMWLSNPSDLEGIAIMGFILFVCGALFSTCWGATFGWLYSTLARDFYVNARG